LKRPWTRQHYGWQSGLRLVTRAIQINREVGGNLAEVLDGVGHTIRERNQTRRQVKTLAAEGKLSAYVLIALPLAITGFLSISNLNTSASSPRVWPDTP
jgi:tight adherence protein B